MELFYLKILLGAFLISALLALFSFIVYFFRLAFLSIAVSHAVLAGLAVGVFLHTDPTIVALIFSLLVGFAIAFLKRSAGLTEDASIGIVLALSMAFGIILIYLSEYQGNLFAYLFGSLMTISLTDIVLLTALLFLSLFFFYKYLDRILFLCFDEETAYSSGINTTVLYYSLVAFLSFLITFSTKLIGVILTHAMLVIPAAVAGQVFWHYKAITTFSFAVSFISTFGGLAVAYIFDLPTGPSIVLLGGLLFVLLWLFRVLIRLGFKTKRT